MHNAADYVQNNLDYHPLRQAPTVQSAEINPQDWGRLQGCQDWPFRGQKTCGLFLLVGFEIF